MAATLIIWTLWSPMVPMKAVEIPFPSMELCLAVMEQVVETYEMVDDEGFYYRLQCEPRG